MSAKIMCVDDSICVLESLKWIFSDTPFYVLTFCDPVEALSQIADAQVAVVVVEQSMKKMDGIKFFKKARKRSPNTIAIMMTGYSDYNKPLEAIDQGSVYYGKKPLNNNEIRSVLIMPLTKWEINRERTI